MVGWGESGVCGILTQDVEREGGGDRGGQSVGGLAHHWTPVVARRRPRHHHLGPAADTPQPQSPPHTNTLTHSPTLTAPLLLTRKNNSIVHKKKLNLR